MIISTFFDNLLSIAQQNGLTLLQVAERCLKCDVTGIEVEDCEVADPRLQVLLDAGMQITGMPTRRDFLHAPSRECVEEVIRLALKHSVPRILMIPGYIESGEDKSIVRNAIEPLQYLCELAEKENITDGVEDYDRIDAPTCTIDGLNKILNEVPGLSCFFDTGNFMFAGENVLDAYYLMKQRITSQIHCKDRSYVGRAGDEPVKNSAGEYLYPCAVGKGAVPIREILTEHIKSGFDGVLTAELFGTSDTLSDLETSADFLKKCIAEATE